MQRESEHIHGWDLSKADEIAVIGDRLSTDVLFGNLNNLMTVWVHNNLKNDYDDMDLHRDHERSDMDWKMALGLTEFETEEAKKVIK